MPGVGEHGFGGGKRAEGARVGACLLMTTAGAETITRDPQNGRVTGTTLGAISDAYTYDANGQLASYIAKDGSTTLYAETINTRDGDGRITERTETVGSVTHVWSYGYDTAGRLTAVTEDGTEVSQYAYDADDNRTTFVGASGTVSATYDAQDRLLTYGGRRTRTGRTGSCRARPLVRRRRATRTTSSGTC